GISFYDIETWSLLQATIAHSLSMMISFIVVFSALQWVPFTLVNCLVIAALVLVTYALIWVIMYWMWKKEVEKMNEDLKAFRVKEGK
ncbi:MAG TPA: DUF3021 domain-containing protein, partial [Bacilli bacterium]|nr:DUF3021 domain-containing protein [Bacilli bacterium]